MISIFGLMVRSCNNLDRGLGGVTNIIPNVVFNKKETHLSLPKKIIRLRNFEEVGNTRVEKEEEDAEGIRRD